MANDIEITIKSRDQTNLDRTLSKTRGESDKLKTSLDGVGKTDWDPPTSGASKFKGALLDVGKAAGGFLAANVVGAGAEAILGFMTEGIGLASDMNEALSKSNTVFGESGAAIEKWAGTTANSIGVSKGAALEAAGSFGNMFDQLGLAEVASADMSVAMIDLAADLGSFHNADITEVLDSQAGAFRGEYDQIQKFLPLLNAATVEQRAMAMTGKENADSLNEQDKALAVYQLMLDGAGAAQGDFAKTADGAANAQKRANAEMEDAQTKLGEEMMPLQMMWIELQTRLAEVLVDQVIPALKDLKGWIKDNEETLRPLAILLGVGLAVALALVLVLLVAISTPVILLIKLFQILAPVISDLWGRLREFWDGLGAKIAESLVYITGWRTNISGAFANVKQRAEELKNGIISAFSQMVGFVQSIPGRIASAASGMWDSISDGFRRMINSVIGWWNRLSFTTPSIKIDGPNIFGKQLPGVNIGSRTFSVPQIGRLQSGGTRSGLALVGEAGPELADFGAGGSVIGANRTAAMMAGSGGGVTNVYYITVEGSIRSDRDLVKLLTKEIDGGAIPGLTRSTA